MNYKTNQIDSDSKGKNNLKQGKDFSIKYNAKLDKKCSKVLIKYENI